MSKDREYSPLDDDTNDTVPGSEETSAAEDEMNEAKENLRKALQEVQEENESQEKSGKKEKEKKKHLRTPEEEAERALNSAIRRKRWKYGTLATVVTIVMVAIVVVINVIVKVLDQRYNLNIDLTSSGLYQIDDKTVEYLQQIKDDISITVLASEDYFYENSQLKVVAEILNRFRTESNEHISVEYVDMTKNPEAVRKYSENYSGEFSTGDIVVANKEDSLIRVLKFSTEVIKTESSIDYATYQQTYKYTFVGEKSLVSALMGVTDLNPVEVAFINQSGGRYIYYQYEQGCYERLSDLLTKNNYKITEVDLTTDALDDKYAMAILCAPLNDLTEQQVQKLTDYMYNGGKYGKNMIYFGSPYQKETPQLDQFLETWGIKLGAAIVNEGNDAAAQYLNTVLGMTKSVPVVTASGDELNAGMTDSKIPIVAPFARPIELLFESNSGRTTGALLTTSETCFLYPLDLTEETAKTYDESTAERGSHVIAARADTNFTENNEAMKSTLTVFGSAWFVDYYVAASSSYNNADYFITLMNNMSGKESVIAIADKSLDQTVMEITTEKANLTRTITMFIIPGIVAVLGIAVFIRRKNK